MNTFARSGIHEDSHLCSRKTDHPVLVEERIEDLGIYTNLSLGSTLFSGWTTGC
jgi:hypothetical protein